ncbi:hypothetical protein D3C87_1805050 [compost metagenome]
MGCPRPLISVLRGVIPQQQDVNLLDWDRMDLSLLALQRRYECIWLPGLAFFDSGRAHHQAVIGAQHEIAGCQVANLMAAGDCGKR